LTATVNSGTIIASVNNKTTNYNGNAQSPNTVTVTEPANGYTIKYGTTN
jgi:hypothetical protein